MHLLKQRLLLSSLTATTLFSDCSKSEMSTSTSSDVLMATGLLQQQGMTTYQYGTHTLTTSGTNPVKYVLKSNTIDLNGYVGSNVTITAVNTHYTVENGPLLYNVTAISR